MVKTTSVSKSYVRKKNSYRIHNSEVLPGEFDAARILQAGFSAQEEAQFVLTYNSCFCRDVC
jgi:hypothetical protein